MRPIFKLGTLLGALKGLGGSEVKKNKLTLYERPFQYEGAAFYRMWNFNSYLKIFAFEYGRIWRKLRFSLYISYTKWYIINGPNNDLLELKMPSDFVFDGFSCTSTYQTIKITKTGAPNGFLEILKGNRSFFAKNGPKILKPDISKTHFLELVLLRRSYNHEIWPSYGEKWLKKFLLFTLSKFGQKVHFRGPKWPNFAFFAVLALKSGLFGKILKM